MKIFFALFFLLAVMLAVYPFIFPPEDSEPLTGLPWQIEMQPDGSIRVFGMHIGSSRLSDAIENLGNDMELAIIATAEEDGNLEMYYGHYKAGLLSGKLVLQTRPDVRDIKNWRENAVKSEYMASGKAKKYFLSVEDLPRVLDETITGATFIPAVNLDDAVIRARFGEPAQLLESAGVTHYLYPDKGLDIVLSESSKEVFQYVSPGDFQQLMAPLK